MSNFIFALAGAASGWEMYVVMGVIVLMFVVMVTLQSKKRKKSQDEYTGMLDTLRPGMRVKTVGGVIGRIKEIREEGPGFKTVLLETGTSTVLYDLQAIYGVVDDEAILAAKKAEQERLAAMVTAGQTGGAIGSTGGAVGTSTIPTTAQENTNGNGNVDAHKATYDGVDPTQNVFEAKKTKK